MLWPYEETKFAILDLNSGSFVVTCPWLVSEVTIEPGSKNCDALLEYINNGQPSADIQPVWDAMVHLPIAYKLPRLEPFSGDKHVATVTRNLKTPKLLAEDIGLEHSYWF